MIATAPCGTVYAIEVKNTAAITTAHRKQAIEQAKERKAAWMLARARSQASYVWSG